MKTFLKIYGVLFILLFQFTGCMDDDNRKPVYYFYDEPVVVDQTGDQPFIRNQSHLFYVPGLADNTTLKKGDLLWTSFIVDLDDQDESGINTKDKFYIARQFKYKTVDSSKVVIPANDAEFQSYLSDDYTAPVNFAVLYNYSVDSLLFFGFKQGDRSNQLGHVYELILNPKIEKGKYPTLYIRSKQINASTELQAGNDLKRTIFAIDATDFVNYYRKNISPNDMIRFNLKYKTGIDSEGKDIYKEFMSNPISWNFGNKKK